MTLSCAGSAPVASSAASGSTRCKKPVSLIGGQSSRPPATAHASNDASLAGDRPGARSIARLRSSTQPSRPRRKTLALGGRNFYPPRTVQSKSGNAATSLGEWTFTRTSAP